MDSEAHIEMLRKEMWDIIYSEVISRYKVGVSYFTFNESKELNKLLRSSQSFGFDSLQLALERVMWSDEIKDYVDGLAIGDLGSDDAAKGLYWDFKLTDQLWDCKHEFGTSRCPQKLITEEEAKSLRSRLFNDEDITRFVFKVMREICLSKSLLKKGIRLSDNWVFQSIVQANCDMLSHCEQALKDFICPRGFSVKLTQPKGRVFSGKAKTLDGRNDIEITW